MSDHLIELGLFKRRKNDAESPTVRMGRLLGRLVALISEIAVDSEGLKTSDFRARLARIRGRLEQASDSSSLERSLEECLDLSRDYFRQAQGYLVERESEILQIVEVLREATSTLTGGAADFNQRILDSSARLKHLTDIEDLRELKRQITREVKELSLMAAEKRKQDEALHAKMARRFDVLEQKLRQTRQEVMLDPLTGVGNRRSIDEAIHRSLLAAMGNPVIVAILDLDDFKQINDSYGHHAGDQVLICVAGWLTMRIRTEDFIGRYGGDEFVIIFNGTTLPQAEIRFLQLLSHIASTPVELREVKETRSLTLTVSCGLTESHPGDEPEDLLRRADKALYQAKREGKNRLSTHREPD